MKFAFAKKSAASTNLVILMLMLLSPMVNAFYFSDEDTIGDATEGIRSDPTENATEAEMQALESAERICEGLEGAEYSNCIDRAGENYLEAEEETQACEGLEGEAYAECIAVDAPEDYETGPTNMPTGSSSGDTPPRISMPTIPKPALLPGPDESSKAKDVQGYFRNKAIPGFTAGFIGLIGGMAIIALVWSGIRFISAGGEEEAITSAKKTATWAIAGFAIAILSYAIVSIITSIKYPTGTTPAGAPAEEESVIYKNN